MSGQYISASTQCLDGLRAEAERAGIQTYFEIPSNTESPKYLKAQRDLEFARHMLSLPDDDPRLVEVLEKSGLYIDQYRQMMQTTADQAERTLNELSAAKRLPTNEFLAYVVRAYEDQTRVIAHLNNRLNEIENRKRKNKKSISKRVIFLLVLAILAVCYGIFTFFDTSTGDASSNKRICASPTGEKYHLEGCVSLQNSKNLNYYADEQKAKENGYEPCSICFGTNNGAVAKDTNIYISISTSSNYHSTTHESVLSTWENQSKQLIYYHGINEAAASGKKPCPVCVKESPGYVASAKGSVYHLETCPRIIVWDDDDGTNRIYYKSAEEAASSGKTPCETCIIGTGTKQTTSSVPASQTPIVSIPAVAMPSSGTMVVNTANAGDPVAPLEIKTSGKSSYYIKMESVSDPSQYVTYFIRAGLTTEVDMPLGRYYLKYASGVTWYGARHLFGPATTYAKSDDIFEFYEGDDSISGYTITLYPVTNGNMHTEEIDASEF